MTRAEYFKLRSIGVPAERALRSARFRYPHEVDTDALRNRDPSVSEVDGLQVSVRLIHDDFFHLEEENIGRYTDTAEPGAIRRMNARRGEYKFFVPEARLWEDLSDSYWLVKQGKPRHDRAMAIERQAREQFKLAERLADDYNVQAMCIKVTVSKCDIELADIVHSVGIVDFDSDWWGDTAMDVVNDAIPDALAEARDKLEELRK